MSTLRLTEIREARRLIRQNLPTFPCTFGDCINKCGRDRGGRGGGPCLYCATDKLASLVGHDLANAYVETVRLVRQAQASGGPGAESRLDACGTLEKEMDNQQTKETE